MGIISNRAINFISNDSLLQTLLVKHCAHICQKKSKLYSSSGYPVIRLSYESTPHDIYLHNHTDSETVNDTFFVIIDP